MNQLNDFIANVKQGMAKTSYFTVEMLLPSRLVNEKQPIRENLRAIQLFCDQTQLPGISFGTAQVRSHGEFKEVPYEKLYEPVTMNFYVDKELNVKYLFDSWMDIIQDGTSRTFSYPNTYTSDKMRIVVEDTEGQGRYEVNLFRCYPKSVAPIQLDYSSKDVMKLQVTFTYQYATYERLAQQGADSSSPIEGTARQLPNYNYGYPSETVIPDNYFTDFRGFQDEFNDFTLDGVKTTDSTENIGEFTGFGGIFS
jgi:hypothetical protein